MAVASSLRTLGFVLHRTGRYAEAELALTEALKIARAAKANPAAELHLLGSVIADQNRPAEAEPLLREALAIRQEKYIPSDPRLAETRRVLAACLTSLHRVGEAEALLKESYQGVKENPYARKERDETIRTLVAFYSAHGREREAAPYRRLLARR
jgi:tetratricopeptide (TPR) repeat protein